MLQERTFSPCRAHATYVHQLFHHAPAIHPGTHPAHYLHTYINFFAMQCNRTHITCIHSSTFSPCNASHLHYIHLLSSTLSPCSRGITCSMSAVVLSRSEKWPRYSSALVQFPAKPCRRHERPTTRVLRVVCEYDDDDDETPTARALRVGRD